MVNIENLNKHTDKIGGIPSDVQNFAEYFGEEATADKATVIAGVLHIPAATIGPFFFAPATKTWHHARPETYEDELTEIFARTKLLANDYDLRALSNVCDHVMEV